MQVDPREEYQKMMSEKRNAKKQRINSVLSQLAESSASSTDRSGVHEGKVTFQITGSNFNQGVTIS